MRPVNGRDTRPSDKCVPPCNPREHSFGFREIRRLPKQRCVETNERVGAEYTAGQDFFWRPPVLCDTR